MRKNYKIIIMILIMVFVFAVMFILNHYTLFATDDYPYQYIFKGRMPTSNVERIENPIQIFTSMWNHWHLWGGRVVVHYLLQFAFMIGKNFFDIVNSIMFVLLGYLIYKHINNTKEIKIMLLITIYLIVFLFIPQPGASILWKSGSANYLWSSVLILCMTLLYKKHLDDSSSIKDNSLNMIFIFIYGLLIGCSNENSGSALIVTIILFILCYKSKYKSIPKWAISGLIGTIISYVLLLISPGNYLRAKILYPGVKYGFDNIFGNTVEITKLTYDYMSTIVFLVIITSVVIFKYQKNIKKLLNDYSIQIIFIIFSLVSIYSLVMSPYYPERSWVFSFVYLTIVIGINYNTFLENKKYKTVGNKLLVIIMLCLSFKAFYEYKNAYFDIINSNEDVNHMIKNIYTQKKNGEENIKLHKLHRPSGKYNAFTYNGFLDNMDRSWTNVWIAEYYGVNSIVADN